MARIDFKAKQVYLLLDLLLLAQVRVYTPSEERNVIAEGNTFTEKLNCHFHWYSGLCVELSTLIKQYNVSTFHEPYVRHFVWCYLQVHGQSNHQHRRDLIKHLQINSSDKDGFVGNVYCFPGIVNDASLIHQAIENCAKKIGFDADVVYEIANTMLVDEVNNFKHIDNLYLQDFVLNIYTVENPQCTLELLQYSTKKKYISSKKIKDLGTYNKSGLNILLRLALYQEFVEIAFYTEHYTTSKETIDFKGEDKLDDWTPERREFHTIKTPALGLKLKSMRRYFQSLCQPFYYSPCPIQAGWYNESQELKLLKYAANYLEPQYLINKENQSFKFDKMLSALCSFYLQSFYVGFDIDNFERRMKGEKSLKVPPLREVSNQFISLFKNEFGISIINQTLEKTYRDQVDTSFPRQQALYEVFCHEQRLMPYAWYQLQQNSLHIEDYLTKLFPNDIEIKLKKVLTNLKESLKSDYLTSKTHFVINGRFERMQREMFAKKS